jgi:cyclophilin family peptidyl-prolyl cis-trans isomerase
VPTEKRQRQKQGRQSQRQAAVAAQRRAERRRKIVSIVLVIAFVAAGAAGIFGLLTRSSDDDKTTTTTPTTASGPSPEKVPPVAAGAKLSGDTPCPKPDGSSPRTTQFEKAPPMCIDPAKRYTATFDTSAGKVVVPLDTKTTPGTVNNFVVLARYHYYDGTAIHRTDPSIDIIQGGSPNTQDASDPGPGYTIKDEGDPKSRHYVPGDLVMARSQGTDSGGAQFFFVAGPKASALDSQGTYVTFGHVSEGLEVVQQILASHMDYPAGDPNAQLGGAPAKAVVIKTVTITEET